MDKVNKSVVIIGSEGFIGRNLVNQCLLEGFNVIGIDKVHRFKNVLKNYSLIQSCVNEFDFSSLINHNIEFIYHLAARTDLNGNDIGDYMINFTFSEKLINFSNKSKAKFIYFSSQLVNKYGVENCSFYNSDNFYGASKALGESAVINKFNNYRIVRPSSVWGPHMKKPYSEFFSLAYRIGFVINSNLFDVQKSFYYVGNCFSDTITNSTKLMYLTNQPMLLSDWMNCVGSQGRYKEIKINKFLMHFLFKLGWSLRVPALNKRRFINMTTSTNIIDFIHLSSIEFNKGMNETWINFKNNK
jgi:hypothetical protein